MTPDEFLRSIGQRAPAPAYLFVGPEPYARKRCRQALIEKVLPGSNREEGLTRHDLDAVDLAAVVDDARSLSLFTAERLIWVSSAETTVPKGRSSGDEDGDSGANASALLKELLANPVPGVVVVFDSSRLDFEGDDKTKLQRVQKFFNGVPQVEFARYTLPAGRKLAADLVKANKLLIGEAELELLVEILGGEASRIAAEIEKLSIYAGTGKRITSDDIEALAPSARASTLFTLVSALGRSDRTAALESLDILVREGEYLPLALSFLNTQFRLALVAKESRLSNPGQIQTYFTRQGTAMWRGRAEQVAQTASAFSLAKLQSVIVQIYEVDKALRDTRPDDRTVMEQFVLKVTEA